MRKLAVALALSTTALASPALARDHSWYVGVEGGPNIVEDIQYDIGDQSNAGTVDSKYGYTVDGVAGYDFGAFRLEAEVGYQHANVDGYSSTVATPYYDDAGALHGALQKGAAAYRLGRDQNRLAAGPPRQVGGVGVEGRQVHDGERGVEMGGGPVVPGAVGCAL